jgi:hypothetical protein
MMEMLTRDEFLFLRDDIKIINNLFNKTLKILDKLTDEEYESKELADLQLYTNKVSKNLFKAIQEANNLFGNYSDLFKKIK